MIFWRDELYCFCEIYCGKLLTVLRGRGKIKVGVKNATKTTKTEETKEGSELDLVGDLSDFTDCDGCGDVCCVECN